MLAEQLPVPVAADVVLAGRDGDRVGGTVVLEAGRPARWAELQVPAAVGVPEGPFDVHLRPSQAAADGERELRTYWGEPVVFEGVEVNAPYAGRFDRDESRRPAVEAALGVPRVTRWSGQGRLDVAFGEKPPPVRLEYEIVLAAGGKEWRVGRFQGGPRRPWRGRRLASDPLPPGLTHVDVVLRPYPEWEWDASGRHDPTVPRGGEVVFRDVPVREWETRAKPGTTRPSTGRAVLP